MPLNHLWCLLGCQLGVLLVVATTTITILVLVFVIRVRLNGFLYMYSQQMLG